MSFQHIRTAKGSELAEQQIKERIRAGEYPPGSKLPAVTELAKAFQVGVSTVREALSALKATGWVDIRHGSGTYVSAQLPQEQEAAPVDPFYVTDSLRDMLEVRKYIESGCAALAARRRTEQDVEELEGILRRMENALGDEKRSEEADIAFHMRIAAASNNPLLVHMMESLRERLHEHMKDSRRLWFFAERSSAEQLLNEHRGIFESIRDADETEAARRMLQHIEKVERTVQELIQASLA
jgi:GntR family transcriptional repressor for pyruvate dehydrogenase complex